MTRLTLVALTIGGIWLPSMNTAADERRAYPVKHVRQALPQRSLRSVYAMWESVADESVQVHIRATLSMGPTDRMAGMDFGEPTLIAGGSSCLFQLPWAAGISAPPRGPVGDSAGQFERPTTRSATSDPSWWNVRRSRLVTQDALVTPLPPSDLPTPRDATPSLSNCGNQ